MKEADSQVFDLWKEGRMHDPNAAVLAVNPLCFHDPGDDSGQGNPGAHLANISWFMQEDDGRRHVRTLRTRVHNAMNTCAKDVLEILVFCRSGRHRNMALSVCFQRALTTNCRVEGAPRLEHLNRQVWTHMHGWCGDCAQCTGVEAKKEISNISECMTCS